MPTRGKVLVIDDSRLALAVVKGALESAQFEVEVAEGGALGLKLFQSFQPDVVVCDMQMPELSGLDVIRAIRVQTESTPVLVFTESDSASLAVSALQLGAHGYLFKGLSDAELVREIESAMRHRRVLERNRELEIANREYREHLEAMVAQKTTEIAKLEHLCAQAEKAAEMNTLAAGVAHEINNPLGVVVANLAYLEAPDLPRAEVDEVLAEARTCALRIKRIVQALQRFARPAPTDAGGNTCKLIEALQESRLICRERVGTRTLISYDEVGEDCQIPMAHDDLVSVISNLVVNAAHAVEERTAEGRVAVRAQLSGGRLKLEVEDNGCGIPEESLGRLGVPFYTTKRHGKGTGLGLALVQERVRCCGGDVTISSHVGQGTRVLVTLPAQLETAHTGPTS